MLQLWVAWRRACGFGLALAINSLTKYTKVYIFIMLKSFKYRLRPTKKQEKTLLAHIEECRLLYNQLVCARVQAWDKESLSRYEQQATLPMLKHSVNLFLLSILKFSSKYARE